MVKAPKFFIQLPSYIASRTDITSLDKLVYAEIYTMINVTDRFYMSSNSLGKRVGKSKRSIIRSINRLNSKKLIKSSIKKSSGNETREITLTGDIMTPGAVTSCHRPSDNKSPQPVTSCHPNRSESKSVNKSSDKSNSKSGREIPKFSKICRYYDQELMINRLTASQTRWLIRDAKEWSKQFSLVTIKQAIDTAHKADLEHNLHNPVPYINRVLANAEYRKKNSQSVKHDPKPDYYSHEQFLNDDMKQQQEALAHFKKIGWV